MKKRTATITWVNFYNFGTSLQAFALQKVIHSLGFENEIIDDKYVQRKMRGKLFPIKRFLLNMRDCMKSFGNKHQTLFNENIRVIRRQYHDFHENYLSINSQSKNLSKIDNQYDIFICGSDQIWNPSDANFSPFYYLDFTNKKKISYAPSLGSFNYPEEFKVKTKHLLDGFNFLSVREESTIGLLKDFIDKDIKAVLDPTLLLTKDEWIRLLPITDKDAEEKSLLCYFIYENEEYLKFVKNFSREHSLKLKIFGNQKNYFLYADEIISCGPIGFLKAIKQSTYFITDSFHGSIFAVQFEKNFCTLKSFKDDSLLNQNARIANLFSKLGLSDYYLGEKDLDKIESLLPIDYLSVNPKLINLREDSLFYLRNALS